MWCDKCSIEESLSTPVSDEPGFFAQEYQRTKTLTEAVDSVLFPSKVIEGEKPVKVVEDDKPPVIRIEPTLIRICCKCSGTNGRYVFNCVHCGHTHCTECLCQELKVEEKLLEDK
jgi:hypothetical protein